MARCTTSSCGARTIISAKVKTLKCSMRRTRRWIKLARARAVRATFPAPPSYHVDLEARTRFMLHGKEGALLFTSGYVSNDATLSTLAKLFPNLWIFSDAQNHASMIEGIKRARCEVPGVPPQRHPAPRSR
jgi:7-keto-8-aminopelargonate synthetase-like enzyme